MIVQNQVLCPSRSLGIRKRLCCSALLDCGVKLNTIEPEIKKDKGKIYLTGEYQSTLRDSQYRMGDIDSVIDGLCFPYQEHLNRNVSDKWTMVADIPPGIEVETNFVDPMTNLPIEDPITLTSVPPDAAVDGLCSNCIVAHFFILSVDLENKENPSTRRSRTVVATPPPKVKTQKYTTNRRSSAKRNRSSAGGNGGSQVSEDDSLNEVMDDQE